MALIRRIAWWVAIGAVWLTVGVGALVLSATVQLAQDGGRQLFGQALTGILTRGIPGSITVERVLEARPDRVRVRGLVIREPDADTKVLEVGEGSFNPDLVALFNGQVILRDVKASDAHLWAKKPEKGRMGLSRAFSRPPSQASSSGSSSSVVILEPIALHDATADFDFAGTKFSFDHVDGYLNVRLRSHDRFHFDRLEGVFRPPKGPLTRIPFRSFGGRVHGDAERLADLKGQVQVADRWIGAHVVYLKRETPPNVRVELATSNLSVALLTELGFATAAKLLPKISGDLELRGSLSGLEVHAPSAGEGEGG